MLNSLQDLWRSAQDIDRDAPMAWPNWLRQMTYAFVCAACFCLLWALWLSAVHQALKHAEVTHERLKTEFSTKLHRAAPLSNLQGQRAMLEKRLLQLEKQLPDVHEMDRLLSDLSRAGQVRHLRFELLRPNALKRQTPYAQQDIHVRVMGQYHDLAGFAEDMAGLAWLVSIQSFTMLPAQGGVLVMDAVVRTLCPLDTTPTQVLEKGAT
jgi:type IV pilus assembly protein PilO